MSQVPHPYIKFFALCAFFVPMSFLFAVTSPQDSFPFRFYCTFASIVGDNSEKCFQKTEIETVNITEPSDALRILEAKIVSLEQKLQTPISAKTVVTQIATQPESVIKYVYIKGEKGDKGDQGTSVVTPVVNFSSQAFQNIPQPFWNGAGASGNSSQTIIQQVSGLPTGGILGQVLTINASGTPEWILPVVSTSSSSTSTLFAQNGLTLSTTSTSSLVELGGLLTKDTVITQGTSNIRFDRSFASLVNQGTTSWPINGFTFTANNFAGLIASTTNTNITAGINDRAGASIPLYEISNTQIAGAVTNNTGLLIAPTSAQISFANNQNILSNIFTDASGPRLRARNSAAGDEASFRLFPNLTTSWQAFSLSGFTNITFSSSTGVRFGSNLGAYTFPRIDGASSTVLTTNGSGQLSFANPASLIPQNTFWSTTGNSGTDSNINFIGTVDAQDLIFKTNNATTGMISADGQRISFGVDSLATGPFGSPIAIGISANALSSDVIAIGNTAGSNAANADYSNFIGFNAGSNATNANRSNFIGFNAGSNATNASFSIFIGSQAGFGDTVDNTTNATDSSILIGRNTNTGGFSNSIGLGAGSVNTASDQFLVGPTYTQFNMRGVNYFMPSVQGALGSSLVNDGSGVLSWGSPAGSNGLTAYPLGIGLGGTLSTTTTITQNAFNLDLVRTSALKPNLELSLVNKNITVPLNPNFTTYNVDLSGSYVTRNFTASTSIGFGRQALGTATFRAGIVSDAFTTPPYFDAYSYVPISNGTVETMRINNNLYGPVLEYINYGPALNEIRKRSYVQTRNDGGAYIVGSDESLFTRADINANANGNILLRSVNFPTSNINAQYTSGIFSGITLSHASPGFSTTLSLSTTTGVTISNMLGIGLSSPLATLHVATTSASAVARFDNANGYCEINPTSVSLVCTSDRTLKKDITSLPAILSMFTQLNPVTYRWNPQSETDTPQYGLIAQEVETLFPSLVYTNPNTQIKTLAYTAFIPLTIEAVKELNASLGDFTNETVTPESFTTSVIFKRILSAFEWMGVKIEKGIANFENLFAKEATIERLCFDTDKTVCLTKDEVTRILQATQVTGAPTPTPSEDPQPTTDTPATSTPSDDIEEILEDEVVENQEEVILAPLVESTQGETLVTPEI